MQTAAMMNPLARDPEMLAAFRERVENEDWSGARRLSLAMQLHRLTPQKLMERDDVYLRRLARRHAIRRARARLRDR
ncbi:MAG: hypothetical protein NVS3B7_10410 [Candidatus Elarobacter sp.]